MQGDGLINFIKELGPCAVALSGGVDSGVVAAAAFRAHGANSLAVTAVSELCPEEEAGEAARLAAGIGIGHAVIKLNVLGGVEAVRLNQPDRCYHCKTAVFTAIRRLAEERGLSRVLDGTNADDVHTYRPGLKALEELGVVSPLLKLGLGKKDSRALAREFNLPNWDKPSAPCLATRFPYGTKLTEEGFGRVRAAEEYIRSLGVEILRVRDHDGLARIEVNPDMLPTLADGDTRKKIVAKLISLGYNYVALDLEGFRSGSMDAKLGR